jgi:DNA-binding response OmpR family regulator
MSKVIVIDDEPFILMMIEDKLKKANIDVLTLRDSKSAVEVIRREMPDLVILDWMMPELSGIDVCKIMKKDADMQHIPVFMLTAKGQDADEQIGLKCGVTRYITKPFSPKALLEMVSEVIGNDRS